MKDRLDFDAAHLASLYSISINNPTSTQDKLELQCGHTFMNLLKRYYHLGITYVNKEIWLFHDDLTGGSRRINLHPEITGTHAFIIRNKQYVP